MSMAQAPDVTDRLAATRLSCRAASGAFDTLVTEGSGAGLLARGH